MTIMSKAEREKARVWAQDKLDQACGIAAVGDSVQYIIGLYETAEELADALYALTLHSGSARAWFDAREAMTAYDGHGLDVPARQTAEIYDPARFVNLMSQCHVERDRLRDVETCVGELVRATNALALRFWTSGSSGPLQRTMQPAEACDPARFLTLISQCHAEGDVLRMARWIVAELNRLRAEAAALRTKPEKEAQ